MLETGLILKWYQNHLPKERKCDNVFFSIGHVKANLDRTKGPFAVLIAGPTAASIVLVLEILVAKLSRNRRLFKRHCTYRLHSQMVN